jgi:sterol desaturase/sphingolipid hydroxylase (fatty acid hydroxylase superfamily)
MHKPEAKGFSRWPIYKFLAEYHWLHHRYPDKNFNVVFPCADYILGTCAVATEADRIKMKEQLSPQPVSCAAR